MAKFADRFGGAICAAAFHAAVILAIASISESAAAACEEASIARPGKSSGADPYGQALCIEQRDGTGAPDARALYARAAKEGDARAAYRLGLIALDERRLGEARSQLGVAAKRGNRMAQRYLDGLARDDGREETNPHGATRPWYRAIALNDSKSFQALLREYRVTQTEAGKLLEFAIAAGREPMAKALLVRGVTCGDAERNIECRGMARARNMQTVATRLGASEGEAAERKLNYLASLAPKGEAAVGDPALLMLAARSGDGRLVHMLVDRGSDPWRPDASGRSAASTLYDEGNASLARELVTRATSIEAANQILPKAIARADAATVARIAKTVRFRQDAYPRVELSPLWHAVDAPSSVWTPLLSWQGSDGRGGPGGVNLLMRAIEHGNRELSMALLRSGFSSRSTDAYGRTAHWYAAARGDGQLLKQLNALEDLVDLGDETGGTPLMQAVINGHADAAAAALTLGADVDAKARSGDTALTIAAGLGEPGLVRLLLDRHASVDERNADSLTPLMVAASAGCLDCVRALLASGANPARRSESGLRALDMTSDPQILRVLKGS